MKSFLLLGAVLIGTLSEAQAQRQAYNQQTNFVNANKVWAFPDKLGLDFNSGTPIAMTTGMTRMFSPSGAEGAASVCHPITGKLLFYSNGATCWGADHADMQNGLNLGGTATPSSVQGAVIVPFIGDSSKYYLFSLNDGWVTPADTVFGRTRGSLFYSVIDMTLNNGKGDVVVGKKNIPIDTLILSEAMIAIPGNSCDVWLLVHEAEKPNYRAYHITSKGINTVPVTSVTNGSSGLMRYLQGSLAVSPDRKMIALSTTNFFTSGGLQIAKFDPNTGSVTDEIAIGQPSNTQGSSVAFSSDNTKLYSYENFPEISVNQYEVSNFTETAINASKYKISNLTDLAYLRSYGDSIYVTVRGEVHLGLITKPNSKGASCDYKTAVIPLAGGKKSSGTLPTEAVYPLTPLMEQQIVADTFFCKIPPEGLLLKPGFANSSFHYTWQDGTTDTSYEAKNPGSFWVRYSDGCDTYIDTFRISLSDMEIPVIAVSYDTLKTTTSYASYQWMLDGSPISGATQSTYKVLVNGDYQVIITGDQGCVDTSAVYEVTNALHVSTGHSFVRNIKLYPNPVADVLYVKSSVPYHQMRVSGIDGRVLMTLDEVQVVDMSTMASGIYYIHFLDSAGGLITAEKVIKN